MIILLLTMATVVVMGFAVCSRKDKVDSAPLEKSFALANAAAKSGVHKDVAAIKAKNFTTAVIGL